MKRVMNYPRWMGIIFLVLAFLATEFFIQWLIIMKELIFLPFFIIFWIPLVFFAIFFNTRAIVYNKRKNHALEGRRKYGIITEKHYSSNESQQKICKIEFVFKDDYNQQVTALIYVNYKMFDTLRKGMKIPVYVNGQDAFFKDEDVFAMIEEKKAIIIEYVLNELDDKPKYYKCEYCDSKVEDKYLICPNCGAHRK